MGRGEGYQLRCDVITSPVRDQWFHTARSKGEMVKNAGIDPIDQDVELIGATTGGSASGATFHTLINNRRRRMRMGSCVTPVGAERGECKLTCPFTDEQSSLSPNRCGVEDLSLCPAVRFYPSSRLQCHIGLLLSRASGTRR